MRGSETVCESSRPDQREDGRPASVPGCALCAAPGDFGRLEPGNPRSGLCPACVLAGKPTRPGLEQAVLIVARQHLGAAEELDLRTASPDVLIYHLGTLRRSLRSTLQLFTSTDQPVPGAGARAREEREVCVGCRSRSREAVVVRRFDTGSGPVRAQYACLDCAPRYLNRDGVWRVVVEHQADCSACREDGGDGRCDVGRALLRLHRARLGDRQAAADGTTSESGDG